MKRQLFILAVLSITLFSCKNNNDVETLVTVKLNPSFFSLSEGSNEPMKVKGDGQMKMSSATVADSVVYAIQVYENDAPYYYGLFNDVSKMQLALTTSKIYKFKVSAYKIGTGKGLKAVVDTAGTNYFLPNKTPLKNKFIKGDALKDIDLASSIGMSTVPKAYPEVDAFYTAKTLTLDKGTTSVDFTLLRMGFGINFNVDALTSGNMEIYLGNDTIKLNSSKTTAYTVRQFATSTNTFANINSNADTFGDSIAITAKWTSASGTTTTASGKYKFLRNYQKTINIQWNTITNSFNFEGWANFPTNGLVAWYPFNGNANDETGNGHNGTVNGASLTTDRFGNLNKAYLFNSNYIEVPYSSGFNNINFSVSLWVNTTNTSTGVLIKQVTFKDASNERYSLSINDNLNTVRFYVKYNTTTPGAGWYMNSTTQNILDGNYHNLVGTVSGGTTKLYIDGVLKSTIIAPYSQSTMPSGGEIQIGRDWSSNTQYFKGKLDDIGIWNRVLTQDEITSIYNAR